MRPRRFWITLTALLCLSAAQAPCAKRQAIRATWDELRSQIASRGLGHRTATIYLSDRIPADVWQHTAGRSPVKAKIIRIEDTEIVTPKLTIPRAAVTAVEFRFRKGKARLIGSLVGAVGGGAAITAGCYYGDTDCATAAVPVAGAALGGFTGLLIGSFADKQVVRFEIRQPAGGKQTGLSGAPAYPSVARPVPNHYPTPPRITVRLPTAPRP